ncbi:hypothetical protein RSOL_480490 [Rhizoctonia solani AG-3 Rhs1AP]|uniref:Uncharacterized protein n=1 Tax=Rhizoctonia solani AG-3 Rhs1AP TaxID=1086054 RepID=X8JJJ3_9AGAM|nr:hypothetical protein RSOL_480490 [Rhizoctonia solani AG-3 Rhs1AP]
MVWPCLPPCHNSRAWRPASVNTTLFTTTTMSEPLPAATSTGTKRKSTAGASTSKRAKTDPFANTKDTIQTILASPETFSLPSGDSEYRQLVVSIAQYAKSLEGSISVAGSSSKAAPPPKTAEQISAEAERVISQIDRGISKLMTWKTSCKTGSAKYSYDGICVDPRVFGKVLGLDGPPNFKMKKYTKEEFEVLIGCISKEIRFDTLYLAGPVNVRYNPDTGEFKITGSYGKMA